ncbi:MAG: 4Fe-4S binding protein, partial [Alphaproteobacteria bacterium]|nr:4Fe-4S binding protein [Alphaproteobacteria bacterium]
AILRSTRAVARGQGVLAPPANAGLDLESSEPQDFATLLAEGSIAQLRLTLAGLAAAAPAMRLDGLPDSLFIALYAAPLAPARIGRNLLGDRDYAALMASLPAGAQPILLASTGRYSFKGTSFVRTGRFERIRIIQGERGHAVLATQHRRLDTLRAAGSADLTEIGLFILPPEAGLDLSRPWQVELLIAQPASDGADVLTTVPLEYRLPTRYRIAAVPSPGGPPAVPTGGVALPPTPDVPTLLDLLTPDDSTRERPLWERTWRAAPVRITILTGALTLLCALLFVQDWLVKRRTRHIVVRASFLAFTLLWLGWYSGTQLSVVNVLTFVNAVLTGFRWEFFLLDPMAFILWSAVAVWLLFLGRGVFCGWLCPFGALQEFTGTLARRLRLPQVRVPFLLHERMWPAKYMLLLGLVALSLQSLDGALPWTEIEPFKAAIVLRFARPPGVLPFVLAYLAVLLVASLFVERAFCRYICPLGAALAIPARLRMFEWLRRRTQCGTQCQICASRCPVLAIHPDGHINPNECIHCLGCQVNFYDATVCPPLIERQKRRADRREAMNA